MEKSVFKSYVPKAIRNKLYQCHNGYGYIVVKTAKDTLSLCEFSLGKDNKFKTFGGVELPEFKRLFEVLED